MGLYEAAVSSLAALTEMVILCFHYWSVMSRFVCLVSMKAFFCLIIMNYVSHIHTKIFVFVQEECLMLITSFGHSLHCKVYANFSQILEGTSYKMHFPILHD